MHTHMCAPMHIFANTGMHTHTYEDTHTCTQNSSAAPVLPVEEPQAPPQRLDQAHQILFPQTLRLCHGSWL